MAVAKFNYDLDFKNLDFRKNPELYQIGRGEQGVLSVEPYKSEILPHWRFKTPDEARISSKAIYALFLHYGEQEDFVGMDMARKFLQMGYTRARRYANHKSGRKYDIENGSELPRNLDPIKAESAAIFKRKWDEAKADSTYLRLREKHKQLTANSPKNTSG